MSNPESETWSLDSSHTQTVEINGRTYQQWSLDNGTSYCPVDEDERERLNKEHQIFMRLFDDRLIFPPIVNPQRILDCGFGSGAWAVDCAEKYPNCQVIGVDISPHMKPDGVPPNLWLQIDDLNEQFTFQNDEFDFIHSQNVVTGINKNRWPSYIQDCYRVLKPGGWLQLVEFYFLVQSDNGSLTENHALRQMCDNYFRAYRNIKDLRAPTRLDSLMRQTGLTELGHRIIQLPLSGWPRETRDREIGEKFGSIYKEILGSHTELLFAEKLGMSREESTVLIAGARNDLEDLNLKPYIGLYISIGRKPNL